MGYDVDDEDFGDHKDEGGRHNDNECSHLYMGEEGYDDAGIILSIAKHWLPLLRYMVEKIMLKKTYTISHELISTFTVQKSLK